MFLKLSRPIVCFDLETTGVNVKTDRIIGLAAVKIKPNGKRRKFVTPVNPEIPIPEAASKINHIYDKDVKEAPLFEDIVDELDDFLHNCDFLGFNVKSFDLPLLCNEFKRVGRELDVSDRYIIDSMIIYHENEPRTLSDARRFYNGKDHHNAHNALADVEATLAVFDAQLGRYSDMPRTVEEIHSRYLSKSGGSKPRFIETKNGVQYITRGRHVGLSLDQVYKVEPDYLFCWGLIKSDLDEDVKEEMREFLEGKRLRRITAA